MSLLETGTISCRINNTLQSKCTIWPFSHIFMVDHISRWNQKESCSQKSSSSDFVHTKRSNRNDECRHFHRNLSFPSPNRQEHWSQRAATAYSSEPLFLLFLKDLEGVFLAAGSVIRVIPRRAAVLLQGALLVRQLRDAAALPPRLPSSRRWRRVRFSGIEADRARGFRQAVHLSQAGRLLQTLRVFNEDGAVVRQLHGTGLVNAVPSVGGVTVQRHGVLTAPREAVHQRGGFDQVAFGAVGRQAVTNLRERQRRVRIRSV